jgi:hypothetical protein
VLIEVVECKACKSPSVLIQIESDMPTHVDISSKK